MGQGVGQVGLHGYMRQGVRFPTTPPAAFFRQSVIKTACLLFIHLFIFSLFFIRNELNFDHFFALIMGTQVEKKELLLMLFITHTSRKKLVVVVHHAQVHEWEQTCYCCSL